MRFLTFLFLAGMLWACSGTKSVVYVPAQESLEFDYPGHAMYEAILKNKALNGIGVGVVDKSTDSFIRGFGLGTKGKAEVLVEQNAKLVFKNDSDKGIRVQISARKGNPVRLQSADNSISFTLANNTARSLPLIIPNVMNPNLSPFSKSGVDLKIGQEILFRKNGKKYLLFKVDQSIAEGSTIDVAKILKERQDELGL